MKIFEAILDILQPTAKLAIPFLVPFGGEIMDALGFTIYPEKSKNYFIKFCRQILRNVFRIEKFLPFQKLYFKLNCNLQTIKSQRQETKDGRNSDFINLMLNTYIDDKDKKSATKGMTQDEMIGQVRCFIIES